MSDSAAAGVIAAEIAAAAGAWTWALAAELMASAALAAAALLETGATPVEAALLMPGVTAGKTPVVEAALPENATTPDGPAL